MTEYELLALEYAEKYGIIEYDVNGSLMTWVERLPNEGNFEHTKDLMNGESYVKKI